MLRNYLRIALRTFFRNRVSSVVNIVGLSVAIGCAIVVFLFLERAYTMDRFHGDGDRIFLVENVVDRNGREQLFGDSPMPLGPVAEAEIPQIEQAIRIAYGGGTFQVGDRVFGEGLWYVDEEFLSFFDFPLRAGNEDALSDASAIVLSDRAATRYFGNEDPVGRQVAVRFNDEVAGEFTVTAVADRFPAKASFAFNALLRYDRQRDIGTDITDWGRYTGATFVRLRSAADLPQVADAMERYLAPQNAANEDWPIARFEYDRLHDLSVRSETISSDISGGTHPTAIIVLALVAVFLLALSCFNYMNLAVATASRRLKEIGIRKVVGGSRRQLVGQFLIENVLMCFLALGLGFALAYFLFIPGFNNLFDFVGGTVTLGEANQSMLWVFLVGLMLVTCIASGAYPAVYIASFRPAAILHGQQVIGGGNVFTRAFLALQFVLAFLTMIMGVILAQNADYQADRDWGYEQEHELVIPLEDGGQHAVLRQAVSQLADVRSVTGSKNQPGRSWNQPVLDIEGEKMESVRFEVGAGFLQQYGFEAAAGRLLDDRPIESPGTSAVVNRRFALYHGWSDQEAVGKSFRVDSVTVTIAGVVPDFVYDSIYDPIAPAFFRLVPESDYRYLSMQVAPGGAARTAGAVEETWKRLFPDRPYNGFFQDTVFDEVYRENTNIKRLFGFIAALALLIACLGLFGLTVQNILRRRREIGIRKVLGASVTHITQVVNRSFVLMVVVSAVVAAPLGYFGMKALLVSVYPDPVPIGPFAFLLSFALVAAGAVGTMSTQVRRIMATNPADVLRSE